MVMKLHWSRGFRLWDIMLCSWFSASESSFTLRGFSASFSRAASLVGFARLVKKWWQIFVRPFFVFIHP